MSDRKGYHCICGLCGALYRVRPELGLLRLLPCKKCGHFGIRRIGRARWRKIESARQLANAEIAEERARQNAGRVGLDVDVRAKIDHLKARGLERLDDTRIR